MQAEYDSRTQTLAIDLGEAATADHGDDSIGGAIVHVLGGKAVAIDVMDTTRSVSILGTVAERYHLDRGAVAAAAAAALTAPDRRVDVDVVA